MNRHASRRTLLLACLLVLVAVVAVMRPWSEPEATTLAPTYVTKRSPVLDAFMAQVVAASKIDDPLERCLRMPDPPGSHWHRDAVDAYCRTRNAELMDNARFRALIAAGKGDEVDHVFEGYLQKQMHDPQFAMHVDQAVARAGFRKANSETRAAIDAWKKQRPSSAFAVAASGMQYDDAAFDARGAAFASKTSEAQWQAAQDLAGLARRELDRAAAMQPVIPSIYSHMFSVGVLTDDHRYAMRALERGLEVQPNNVGLRMTEAHFTGEKWGGSTAWVARQADEAAAAAIRTNTPLLWVAAGRARIHAATQGFMAPPADGGFVAAASEVAAASDLDSLADEANRSGTRDEAFVLAVEALRFDSELEDSLGIIGHLATKGYYPDWARAQLVRAAHDHPDSAEVAGTAGVWLRYLGEPGIAEPLMVYATEHGKDDWVLARLGDFYTHEGHDYAKAHVISEELIKRNPRNGDGYVIRACIERDTNDPHRFMSAKDFVERFGSDPYQQGPVAEMRAWLAAHPEPT